MPDAPAILFLHGLGTGQDGYEPRARLAAERLGAACLTFDLGGHGATDGVRERLSARDHLAEACCAYDALCTAGAPARERVGVCGASYGAFLAALLLGERRVSRLLLRAPALYPDAWIDLPLGERGTLAGAPASSLALDRVAAFAGETLVLESGRDAVIERDTIEAYLTASPRVHHEVIAEATHHLSEPAWKARFEALIVEWFAAL